MSNNKLIQNDEKGIILIVVLALIAIIGIAASVVVITIVTDIKISGNYKTSIKAFFAAEAGTEEGRARLRANAGADFISDTTPELAADYSADTDWRVYLGTLANVTTLGYDPVAYPNDQHKRYNSFSPGAELDYTVEIRHATDTATGAVLYWGDHDEDGVLTRNTNSTNGSSIYMITSYGSSSNANTSVETELSRLPPVFVPAALYVESQTDVMGNSTYVEGDDSCGDDDKAGITTTLADEQVGFPPEDTIEITNATVSGTPATEYDYGGLAIDYYFDYFSGLANFSYDINDINASGNIKSWGAWGSPTGGRQGSDDDGPEASTCNDNNIIYIDTNGMTGNEAKLSNETGCGVLLVDGDLAVSGGFSWYGVIITTGNIKFTGGGNKLFSGAILTKGSAATDIGGNVTIVFCSDAISDQTENQPLISLSWRAP